ncbi:precorrin-6y C5,15-methyltransferase (decarboxylating) subunit CbiE [Nitrospirillum amazonense]|uniref:precorrin-6y C5,15-methyltransferase (decarboxylating) subunit CbiE n=1 Tax=Nitrospirillum amazonense TaxID=28077 RepID=UPI002DD4324B|nr:precorrin-6y C5,15-methyltransferase (decarboxylating) subunit CbiE [Nitrospirillum amazonense]MEC4594309.1 precorrin-6y C5,15-methyltransferase (decarboxylating) subunit CbiE [Nitrospirillum amazonense]
MTSTGAPWLTIPWLTIVGIGEDGWDSLSPAARAAVTGSCLVVGGTRHLALVPETAGQERLAWPSPLSDAFPTLLARRGQAVTVLASGDPQWFGIGATLARLVPPAETRVLPAPGAFTLAAARLGWALQDIACLSLHGRPLENVIPHLFPGARLLLLSWDGTTPAKLAALLRERGFGPSTLTVLEAMGGPRERISSTAAETWSDSDILDLNTIALACAVTPGARVLPRSPGLPDDWFQHDGKITKREVRAVALSHLAPGRGETLWDVGAGSGSIAIEWLLADPANRAVAVEDRADRMAAIRANALTFGVPNLDFREGVAPDALADLPQPDAVFIGGGLTGAGVVEACWQALRPGGRLVATAVTLETEAALSRWHTTLGGSLTRLSVERAVPLGKFRGWRPLMPVTLWRVEKPL